MPKKKAATVATGGKAASKAAKKAKAAAKVEKKETKKAKAAVTSVGKGKGKSAAKEEDDQDLEGILEKMQKDWELAHTVTEEIGDGPPSRRANATLTPCPLGNHLWCIGGEYFADDGKAHFYNDVYRYSPDKDEWRRFASPTCPGPRSAHAVVASPAGGGKLFLFGGEFSSLYQNSFHHYRDFWVFDVQTHLWDRIETKVRPSGRSGHRMILWKHFIVLFGGFVDPGIRTNYLQDLWLFDILEYKWIQVEFKETERRPSARSGFSFLPVPEGAILHGGYYKEYSKGKRPVGIALEDTWLLKMDAKPSLIKWERRKKIGYAPGGPVGSNATRSGCTMAYWSAKGMGVLFGGVCDVDTEEELESVFFNDMYGYQVAGNGRWISLALKKPKKKGSTARKKKVIPVVTIDPDENEEAEGGDSDAEMPTSPLTELTLEEKDVDPDDPNLTLPLVRYNAMLAVLRNTLYIYGGIYERGAREYTLDDFYTLQLDKLDRFVCLKESGIVPLEGENDESEDDDSDGDEGSSKDGESDSETSYEEEEESTEQIKTLVASPEEEPEVDNNKAKTLDIRQKAQALLQQSKQGPIKVTDAQAHSESAEEASATPLPGDTLAAFYARTKDHWARKALQQQEARQGRSENRGSENRAKVLRRDGFALAEERWAEYKPILEEVEKILKEAGDDVSASGGKLGGGSNTAGTSDSRNRR